MGDIGRDDLMGSVNLSVKEIKELNKVARKTVPLNFCKSGKIVFSFGLNQDIPFVPEENKDENIKTPAKKEEIIFATTPDVEEKKPEPANKVNIDEKPNLKTKEENELKLIIHKVINLSNKDLIGKSDPYVFVQYGNKKFKSQTVKANLNP